MKLLVMGGLCKCSGDNGEEESLKKWASEGHKYATSTFGGNSRQELAIIINEALGYKGMENYTKAIEILKTGENIAKSQKLIGDDEINKFMGDLGGSMGKGDPLKPFIDMMRMTFNMDYVSWGAELADCYLLAGQTNEGLAMLGKICDHMIASNTADSVKLGMAEKFGEYGMSYPTMMKDLREMARKLNHLPEFLAVTSE